MKTFLAFVMILAIPALLFVASVQAKDQPPKQSELYLSRYYGTGHGVLAHGTILKEEYRSPSSILGRIDASGVWIIQEANF